jgi:hypothetical protein
MSFANEIKEFLGAYTAIREQGRKDKDGARADRELEGNESYREAMLELQRERLDMDREKMQQSAELARARLAGGSQPPSPSELRAQTRFEWEKEDRANRDKEKKFTGVLEALPVDDEFNWDEYGEFSRDVLVKPHHANGGLVDDESPQVQPQAQPLRAQPTPVPQALPLSMGEPVSAPMTAPQSQPETRPQPPEVNPEASRIIVSKAAEAVDQVARSFSVGEERKPAAIGEGSEPPGVDPVTNRGALSMQEYQEVLQKVDRNGQMASHLQSAAVLAEGYQFFMDKGEPEKAVRFAQQIMLTQKNMSQTLGALTMQAIENGDLPSACRLLSDACNKFPSGHEITITPDPNRGLTYTVKDNGELVDQGSLNTTQLWELAGTVQNGSLFLQSVAQFGANQQRNPRMTPERAINAAIDARYASDDANRALDEAKGSGVKGEELREIKEAADRAAEDFRKALARANNTNSRADVNNALKQALETRPPNVPEELMAGGGSGGPGIGTRFMQGLSDLGGALFGGEKAIPDTPPPAAAAPAPAAAPAAAPAPVTPQGNAEPVRVTSQAEFNALPSGTRFIAPDGSLRIKP